jgi:hypothetical protein
MALTGPVSRKNSFLWTPPNLPGRASARQPKIPTPPGRPIDAGNRARALRSISLPAMIMRFNKDSNARAWKRQIPDCHENSSFNFDALCKISLECPVVSTNDSLRSRFLMTVATTRLPSRCLASKHA